MLTQILTRYLGIMACLIQEIVSVYPLLSPPALTAHASNRVCNALALLQCVASHSDTRQLFLNGQCQARLQSTTNNFTAHLPLFLYPFLNTTSKTRPFEYLRLTSLGVIGALVKVSFVHVLDIRGYSDSNQAKRQHPCHSFPSVHRNHSSLSPHNGNGVRTFKNSCNLHSPEDLAR